MSKVSKDKETFFEIGDSSEENIFYFRSGLRNIFTNIIVTAITTVVINILTEIGFQKLQISKLKNFGSLRQVFKLCIKKKKKNTVIAVNLATIENEFTFLFYLFIVLKLLDRIIFRLISEGNIPTNPNIMSQSHVLFKNLKVCCSVIMETTP